MPNVKHIKGAAKLLAEFQARKKEARLDNGESVFVGYTQKYAIYVHEVPAYHEVGNDKFLERPARTLQRELGDIVRKVARRGGTLKQGLVMAGLRLQRESQKQCPVDTGALKASAFTATEEKLEQTAAMAFLRSERVRQSEPAAREAAQKT
jgi:hypothetical protein